MNPHNRLKEIEEELKEEDELMGDEIAILEAEKKGILLSLEGANRQRTREIYGLLSAFDLEESMDKIKLTYPECFNTHPVSANGLETKEEEYMKCSPLPTQERRDSNSQTESDRAVSQSMAKVSSPDGVERHASTPSIRAKLGVTCGDVLETKKEQGQVETLLIPVEEVYDMFSWDELEEGEFVHKNKLKAIVQESIILCTSRHNEIISKENKKC